MAIKKYKPTSPGIRFVTTPDFSEITKEKPEKSLVVGVKKHSGRDNRGRISMRHQGGGHKRSLRLIDFKRDKDGIPARVAAIEYDPNRSARLALLSYKDGEKRYILCPLNLKVGDEVLSGCDAPIKSGNSLFIKDIPQGTLIHNIELVPQGGGKLCRSAGGGAQLMAKEGNYAQLKLPSGEIRKVHINCKSTIGQVGNLEHESIVIGKAGRSRHLGIRPTVRGVAMNPCDHPHGGGEARSTAGHQLTSPWGTPTKGYKTRKTKRTNKFIVRRKSKK